MNPILFVLLSFAGLAWPAQENLDFNVSAEDLATIIQKAKPKGDPTVVAVVDGCREGDKAAGKKLKPSVLGQRVSQALRNRLNESMQPYVQVDSAAMTKVLDADLVDAAHLCDPLVAAWAARSVGANLLLFPRLGLEGESLLLSIDTIRISDKKGITGLVRRTPATGPILEFLNADSPREAKQATKEEAVPSVPKAGKDGVGQPTCKRCPSPQFTDEAVAARFAGIMLLRVIVSAEGKATIIQVQKGAPYGLTRTAIDTVSRWQFNPAKNAEGKPVPVWTMIEITFHRR